MSESSTKADCVAGLRSGLDELHKYQSQPQTPDANPLADVKALFESIPADLQAGVLEKAIGKGIRRFRAAASLLAECQQSERVDNWITASLTHPDTDRRNWMIQIVGNNKLVRFAEFIARIVETDEQCRWFAVIAAGELQTETCCDSLVSLADSFGQEAIPASLIIALSRFSSPRVTPHLERVFRSPTEEREQVFAAWGLARQGHQEAIEYLDRKLDEPDSSSGSRRAAQALSDLFGWDFQWTPEAARKAKERWEESLHNKDA